MRFANINQGNSRLELESSATFDAWSLFEPSGPQVLIAGRSPDCHWFLSSPDFPLLVSREHAVFSRLGQSLTICDKGSCNGTYVNEVRLAPNVPRTLAERDVVSFGGPKIVAGQSPHHNPFLFRLHTTRSGSPRSARRSSRAPEARHAVPAARPSSVVFDLTGDDSDEVQLITSTQKGSRKRKQSDTAAVELQGAARLAEAKAPPAVAESEGPGVLSKLENDLECVICRDWMVAAHSFAPCGHSFCGSCLAGWLETKITCPCCREPATGAPHRALPLDNIISSMIEPTLPEAEKSRRAAAKAYWQKQADKTTARWKQKMNSAAPSSGAAAHSVRMGGMGGFGLPAGMGWPAGLDALQAFGMSMAHMSPVHHHHMARYPGAAARRQAQPPPPRSSLHVELTPRRDASNHSVRCQGCNGCFGQNMVRVRTAGGQGHRWHHLCCLPVHRWAGMAAASIHGFGHLPPADQIVSCTRLACTPDPSVQRSMCSSSHRYSEAAIRERLHQANM